MAIWRCSYWKQTVDISTLLESIYLTLMWN